MMTPPLTELHPIFLIIIKAISMFQKAGYTLPLNGKRILMATVIARLQEQIRYSVARV